MKYFCMPSDFKNDTVDRYAEINGRYKDSQIVETFGQMAPDTFFGSCRSPRGLPQVDRRKLEEYVKYCNGKGIEFNYVVNATCMSNEELTGEGQKKINEFFRTLEDIGVGWVTISLPSLMEIARQAAPGLKIKASTVCQINSPHKAKFYGEMGIGRIVLDEDIYREFDTLKRIRGVYSGDIEIIVNSFCINDCPYKMFHYNSLSHSHAIRDECAYYSSRCRNIHAGAENFMRLNWIRPEDLHYYSGIGIDYFKLQGRTNVYTGDPAKAVLHYIEEHYDGDLISLLELFSPEKPLTLADCRIDNSKLEGFFDTFAADPAFCSKVCDDCGYCRSFAEKSMDGPDVALLDLMQFVKEILPPPGVSQS